MRCQTNGRWVRLPGRTLLLPPIAEINHFHILDFTVIDRKPNAGAVDLEAVPSGRPGVNKEHLIFLLVASDLKNMRMPANKNIGRTLFHLLADGNTVPAQRTTDMSHPEIDALPAEALVQRVLTANVLPVDISVNADQRGNTAQLLRYLCRAEIAGMPDFITIPEIVQHLGIQVAVSI